MSKKELDREPNTLAQTTQAEMLNALSIVLFLFCCFCGLRHSDVLALTWGNIITDGDKISVSIIQKKLSS